MALSLSEAGPGRFGRQVSVIDIYHTIPYLAPWPLEYAVLLDPLRSVQFSEALLLTPGHPSVKGVVRDKPVAQ